MVTGSISVVTSRDLDTYTLFHTEKLCSKNTSNYIDDFLNQNVQRTMKVREQDQKFNVRSYLGL